MTVILFDKL